MCYACALRGLRSRSAIEETAAHIGAQGTLASIAAASAGELAAYDLPSLQMALAGSAAGFGASNPDSGLPANYEPVESAWDIPGPNALVDEYTATSNTSGTLVVDGA